MIHVLPYSVDEDLGLFIENRAYNILAVIGCMVEDLAWHSEAY